MAFDLKILSMDELLKTATNMQKYLEATPSDQEEKLLLRLTRLQILLAKSGKMLADAKHWLDTRKSNAITDTLKEALTGKDWTASMINKKIDALCRDEHYLVNFIDRINSAASNQIKALITIISYRKEQMRLT